MWARLAGHTLLNAFLITILLLIAALPPVFPLRAGGSNLRILYVVTDAYDEVYLKDFHIFYSIYKHNTPYNPERVFKSLNLTDNNKN
jgi:hypothetical protein